MSLKSEGGNRHGDVEVMISSLEAVRRSAVEKKALRWMKTTKLHDKNGEPLRRIEQLLCSWDRALVATQKRTFPRHSKCRPKRLRLGSPHKMDLADVVFPASVLCL